MSTLTSRLFIGPAFHTSSDVSHVRLTLLPKVALHNDEPRWQTDHRQRVQFFELPSLQQLSESFPLYSLPICILEMCLFNYYLHVNWIVIMLKFPSLLIILYIVYFNLNYLAITGNIWILHRNLHFRCYFTIESLKVNEASILQSMSKCIMTIDCHDLNS